MLKPRLRMRSVKEAIDNLPTGICYFNNHDILQLCNRQMYRLGFQLAGQELQRRETMDQYLDNPPEERGVRREGDTILFPDGSAWKFQRNEISFDDNQIWTEYLAFDVTELLHRKQELEKSNEEQREIMKRMDKIARNIITITREEENLSMKMRIHNNLGVSLQSTRQFFVQGCPLEKKEKYIAEQRQMAGTLLGEVGNDDEVNVYLELERIAQRLGIRLITEGALPQREELCNLLAMAVRECMTNTIRHAGGNEVRVQIYHPANALIAVITNNGNPPVCEIAEGGGLSSLRNKVERYGGTLRIVSLPSFEMTVELPEGDESE